MKERFPVLLALSRAALAWERLWPALWPATLVAGLFLALALSDVLPALPGWLHALVLVFSAGALAWALVHLARTYANPGADAARHRLERHNRLAHRPLTALADRLAAGAEDATARALWAAHRARMAAAARNLSVGAPAPGLARRDPFGLRVLVVLTLIVAGVAGGADATGRLARAVSPSFADAAAGPVGVDVWITPPAYTGMAPLFLEPPRTPEQVAEVRMVPAGSAVLAQVSGAALTPRLEIGGQVIVFEAIGAPGDAPGGHRAQAVIEAGDRLVVAAGERQLAAWRLDVVADAAPEVEFTAPPGRTGRSHLRLEYEARDDYGLAGLAAVVRRAAGAAPDQATDAAAAILRVRLPLPGRGSGEAKGRSIRNLTAHPWAGLGVRIHLEATDGRGLIGRSDAVPMVLPDRIFNHPVALAIIEQRKKLATTTQAVRRRVALGLHAIAARPLLFFDDTVVYLALSVSAARLRRDQGAAVVASVQRLLWDTALRIEDGELSLAERDLRDAQERLMRALEEGATGAEIERLMDELQRELEKFMTALRQELERQMGAETPLPPSARQLGSDDLRRLIERARELARIGSRDAARQILAELRRLLESLRSGQLGPGAKEAARARRLLDGLRGLTKRQQELLDETFNALRDEGATRQPGDGRRLGDRAPEGGDGGDSQQNALRRDLGELMLNLNEFLGTIPAPLGTAERAMRGAAGALGEGRLEEALPLQGKAVDSLRRATDGVAERLARRLGGMAGMMRGPRGRRPGNGRDPFGRSTGGAFGAAIDGPGKIPDEMEMRRAREILEELRLRAGDLDRTRLERDYIRRLLRRF